MRTTKARREFITWLVQTVLMVLLPILSTYVAVRVAEINSEATVKAAAVKCEATPGPTKNPDPDSVGIVGSVRPDQHLPAPSDHRGGHVGERADRGSYRDKNAAQPLENDRRGSSSSVP